jgi:hypothetical protein
MRAFGERGDGVLSGKRGNVPASRPDGRLATLPSARTSTTNPGESNLARTNFSFQKRQKELEKKRKKEEKLKKRQERAAGAATDGEAPASESAPEPAESTPEAAAQSVTATGGPA